MSVNVEVLSNGMCKCHHCLNVQVVHIGNMPWKQPYNVKFENAATMLNCHDKLKENIEECSEEINAAVTESIIGENDYVGSDGSCELKNVFA